MTKDLAASLRTMLDEAAAALNVGEAAEAERQAKAICALVRAERDVALFLAEQSALAPEHDDEELRAELRRRLARFVEAERAGAPDAVLERIAMEAVAR
jgi:type IV secretory pathway TrbF-like protein